MLTVIFFVSGTCSALSPDEVLVVANRNARSSMALAEYYMERRQIPDANIVKVWVTDKESCSRSEYGKIVRQVRKHLAQLAEPWRIRCLVMMYGVPLKIAASELTKEDKQYIDVLKSQQRTIERQMSRFTVTRGQEYQRLETMLANVKKKISGISKSAKNKRASVDSEISLVLEKSYSLSGWIPNPYFIGNRNKQPMVKKQKVLMVSRLDGPSPDVVKRIIDDSFSVEQSGLVGRAYFDARYKKPKGKPSGGYALYDNSIYLAADHVRKSGRLPVLIDEDSALFQPGSCPNAALYCGWYSLTRYVDAFDWVKGAVGYHIASSECSTLKRPGFKGWCKMMLEDGVAATVGPTSEPYVQAFPLPEVFFGFLVDGYMTLAECYMVSLPFLSWQMVLVGDPLYRPFAAFKKDSRIQGVKDSRDLGAK